MQRRTVLSILATAPAASAFAQPAYPSRTMRFVIPWPPGQATDLAGRVIAQKLSESLGQAAMPDNKPGAGGMLGTDHVAKAPADGYTILVASSGPITLNPLLQKTPYDVERDFIPVAMMGVSPYLLVTGPAFPASTAKEFVALVKANPGKYTFASSGTGATAHVIAELFNQRAGLTATHVPYKGSAPALTDVASGQVAYATETVAAAMPLVRAGRLRAYGITLARRLADEGVHNVDDYRRYLQSHQREPHRLGIVHPASMHNLLLRYWLASHGIDPDHDVHLQTIPPAQMLADLKDGSIDGFCIGAPWLDRALADGHGFTVAGDLAIWPGHPGKVLGVREDWALAYPNTHIALTKALLEACRYCAEPSHWGEMSELLSDRRYLGMKKEVIWFSETGADGNSSVPHHLFFGKGVNRPSRSEHLWILTQMARWGEIPFPRNYVEILERICAVGVFSTAARELGLDAVSYQRGAIELFDGRPFDVDHPIDYLNAVPVHRDFSIAEIAIGAPRALAG